jgi:hypothetical protein
LKVRNSEKALVGLKRAFRGKNLPRPTMRFRRRAWLEFQRALDPLAPPKSFRIRPR